MNEIDTITITVSRYEATLLMSTLDTEERKQLLSSGWSKNIIKQLDEGLKSRGVDLDKVRAFARKIL